MSDEVKNMDGEKRGDDMLQAFFDACPTKDLGVRCGKDGLIFTWSREGIGFGEVTLRIESCLLVVDDEAMGVDFVLEVVGNAIRKAMENP